MKSGVCIHVLLILLLTLLLSLPAAAEPVHRHILAVIDSSEAPATGVVFGDAIPGAEAYAPEGEARQVDNAISQYAEMPLGHLGFIIDYVDVTERLPDDQEMQRYDAIISWFQDNALKGAADYARWITKQLNRGKKLIAIDQIGFNLDEHLRPIPQDLLGDFFTAFSVSVQYDQDTESPLLIELTSSDPRMTEFERDLRGGLTTFREMAPTDGGARVLLKLKRRDTGAESDAVFIHSKGGRILPGYAVYSNPGDFQSRWRIDPFRFFAEALRSDFPKPDVTTLNGMRLFFSHIDGDGIGSLSRIASGESCGQIAYEEILTKYDLPVSASVIVGDILSNRGEDQSPLAETAKKIFALPNVEPASHGLAHPLIWSAKNRKMALRLPDYAYSPQREIGDSIAYINKHLVPPDKKTDLFFWTGNCRPDAEALAYVAAHGIRAINGGDTQFTNNFPSYTYVAPLFRHVGGMLQNFSADANEIVYTNIWTGPFYGFRYAIETFRRTESPIRLRPIDLYYHYFSVDRESALSALRDVVDWVLTQDVAPVFTSEYLDILQGFLSANIERVAPGRWRVQKHGALRTVRLDGFDGFVDMARSNGVIGFRPHQGSLYVHLDNGEQAEIVLTQARPTTPYLVSANGKVRSWAAGNDAAHFELSAMGKMRFTIGGLAGRCRWKVAVEGKKFSATTDAEGELLYSADTSGNRFEWKKIDVEQQR